MIFCIDNLHMEAYIKEKLRVIKNERNGPQFASHEELHERFSN